ncbi:MAG: HEAT repeat domain-containing protein [Chloroflexaceae bacterium]|nr:HEAT repeat domain-containing protein [Chloroflexaceae bacterium]
MQSVYKKLFLLCLTAILVVLSGCYAEDDLIEVGLSPTVPNTVPELIRVLSSDNAAARSRAAYVLAERPNEAVAAIPALIDNLNYQNSEVRIAAAHALGEIGPPAQSAVPKLMDMVEDQNLLTHVRRAAANALAQIGDVSAVPALAHALYDSEDIGTTLRAAEAIELLTYQRFTAPDESRNMYVDGRVLLVVAKAQQWWEQEGQHQDWERK